MTTMLFMHQGPSDARNGRETTREVEALGAASARFLLEAGCVPVELPVNKDSGIKDFGDLNGKTLVTTAGTTSERLIRKMNTERHMGLNIISAKDHGESFLTLETGRAVAFMMDDALLFGEVAKSKRPQDWVVTGTPQSMDAYGCSHSLA